MLPPFPSILSTLDHISTRPHVSALPKMYIPFIARLFLNQQLFIKNFRERPT